MKLLLLFGVLVAAVYANTFEIYNAEDIINTVNSAQTTWKAGHNFPKDTTISYIKNLLGVTTSKKHKLPLKTGKHFSNSVLPEFFDGRKEWPNCPTIGHVHDQGSCRSSWAVATAGAFSDRLCVATNGNFSLPLSAEEVLSCCYICGKGCNGGDTVLAWEYFDDKGIVTGGDYNSNVGCQPYQVEPRVHHTTASVPYYPTPECESYCLNPEYKIGFRRDHHKVKMAYAVDILEEVIRKELMSEGPLEASFTVYSDFPSYKSGVYRYTVGDPLGVQAVRLIGWGKENGTPYWLAVNSWNTDWGNNGLFKIRRGENECGIEGDVIGATVRIP